MVWSIAGAVRAGGRSHASRLARRGVGIIAGGICGQAAPRLMPAPDDLPDIAGRP
jgi:hypothetical protein